MTDLLFRNKHVHTNLFLELQSVHNYVDLGAIYFKEIIAAYYLILQHIYLHVNPFLISKMPFCVGNVRHYQSGMSI